MIDANTANLPAQKIGAGDLLAVVVYDSPELTRTVRVGEDGFIRLPMLKQRIKATNSMPAELENLIAEALRAEQLIVDPFVMVTVAEYKSRPISVIGAVRKPVTFQAIGSMTLLEALSRAEGLREDAGAEVLVSRTQQGPDGTPASLVQRIPIKALIDAADPEVNLKLSGGEEIRVPEAGKIFVVGNVKKPGQFTVQDNNGVTILKALALAEGLLPYAAKEAYIYRKEAGTGSKNEIPIELERIMSRKSPDAPLLANDILYVPDNKHRRATFSALEKVLLFASGISTALIYASVR